ncbi:MAG: DUF1028 domain-containing protein [Hyphomicrobiaceae bacterium]
MTFSISARCARTGMFGLAVSSSSPAVAARCAHVRANVGACASQNITDPWLGTRMLELLEAGLSAPDAVAQVVASASHIDYRQLAAVDGEGRTGHYSGARTLGTYAAADGPGVVCAGNLLADDGVPAAMVDTFMADDEAPLAERLLGAMRAAARAGGEEGPVHSAGMVLVRDVPWPIADLRVDWHNNDPIGALIRLWEIYEPQLEDYVTRARDPTQAPSYGVPGDT